MSIKFPEWLPDIVSFSEFDTDLEKYLDHLYKIFENDFIHTRPMYNGRPVLFDNFIIDKYPRCFWHIITDHKINGIDRLDITNLSLLRCERLNWIRPVLENNSHDTVSIWENKRGRKMNTLFFMEDYDFLVVLTNLKNKFYLVSSYFINYPNRKRQLIEERDSYLKKQKPPQNGTD